MKRQYIKVNWEGAGYHGFPISDPAGSYPLEDKEHLVLWSRFESVLADAKRGGFSGTQGADFFGDMSLLAIYDSAEWLLSGACADLMGDIGTRQFFDDLRPAVTSILEPTYSIDLGRSLAIWGHLSAVPTLLETLTKIAAFCDAPDLIQSLSVMLEEEPGELADLDALKDMAAYSDKVRRRVDAIAAHLGTDDAIVMFGDLFSVDKLISVLRRRLTQGGLFDTYLRHKFEATTGVDCSGFYQDEILQPTQALALLDEFEKRGGAKAFEPGRRYFFGHPIPD